MLQFKDRVVLITGAGRGIGRQHALFFAERGAKVVVNDYGGDLRGDNANNPQPANDVVAEITAAGGDAIAICCDIGNADHVNEMVQTTVARYGRIDIMIHNASVFAPLGSFEEACVADLERLMRVNVTGGWNIAHAVWPHMKAQGYGRIIMTSSGAGFFGRRRDQAYSVAKSALVGLTKVLATEGEEFNIKVNCIGPISFTDNAKKQGIPMIMEKFAPPILVTNFVALLGHEECPVNGEVFHGGGGFISRVFIGETKGIAYPLGTMTPEVVQADMDRVMDMEDFFVPPTSDASGTHLSKAISSVNPEFREVFEAALTRRAQAHEKQEK
jgi:NAD(P)-dependent dehydrogenase (short-subunit alcohol dehydrogenase family)